MNLRTITMWALYNPKRKEIIATRQFKYGIEALHRPEGCVIVKMKGHYVRRASHDIGNGIYILDSHGI